MDLEKAFKEFQRGARTVVSAHTTPDAGLSRAATEVIGGIGVGLSVTGRGLSRLVNGVTVVNGVTGLVNGVALTALPAALAGISMAPPADDLASAITIAAMAVGGSLVWTVPKLAEIVGNAMQSVYPYTTTVDSVGPNSRKETDHRGPDADVRYEVRVFDDGTESRKVSCRNDWAVDLHGKRAAMVDGSHAYCAVSEDPTAGRGATSFLMTRDEADHLKSEGVFGENVVVMRPTEEIMEILRTLDPDKHEIGAMFTADRRGNSHEYSPGHGAAPALAS